MQEYPWFVYTMSYQNIFFIVNTCFLIRICKKHITKSEQHEIHTVDRMHDKTYNSSVYQHTLCFRLVLWHCLCPPNLILEQNPKTRKYKKINIWVTNYWLGIINNLFMLSFSFTWLYYNKKKKYKLKTYWKLLNEEKL